MTIISSAYVIIYFYLGFIFGFVKSPYSHELFTMLENLVLKIIPIVSIEVTRSVLATRHRKNKMYLVTLTIILILAEINYNAVISLFTNKEELFKYVCSSIFPLIASSILCTYLTLKGSCLLVLIYRLFKELIIVMLPILPNIDWFVSASLFVLSPTFIYLLFKYEFIKEKVDTKKRKKLFFEKITFFIYLLILITLICFMLGAFKYEAIAILSSSMLPTFSRGDVIIFRKLDANELKEIPENTIIIYSLGNQNIAHRVVNRIQENNTVLYQTKGDSNNVADINLVQIEQIKGVYEFHIKYVGFPSIWLYDYFHKDTIKAE